MSMFIASEFDGDPVVISNKKAAEILKNTLDHIVTNDFETILAFKKAIDILESIPDHAKKSMTGNEYQKLAARTINDGLLYEEIKNHALHGMVGEIGELHSIYQKHYQGHLFDPEHAKKELGDLLWFIAEYCTAKGWQLDDIMQMNIEKLKARYPESFDPEKSKYRDEDEDEDED